MKTTQEIKAILSKNGLKATLQRIAVYEALVSMRNHPSVEMIMEFMQKKYPSIASGTVYKTLDVFAENNIIKRVKTEGSAMRYDASLEKHYHLYDENLQKIEDYYDDELTKYLENYFKNKNIPNFKIEDIKLQIVGNYNILK